MIIILTVTWTPNKIINILYATTFRKTNIISKALRNISQALDDVVIQGNDLQNEDFLSSLLIKETI